MNIRRLVMDVDKAVARPSLIQIARAVDMCGGVDGCNIKVNEIDVETIGMNVTIEGSNLDFDQIVAAIEQTGAVVHSLDELVVGECMVEHVPRGR